MKIGIIGRGFVGEAIYESFMKKNILVVSYDKYKNGGIGKFEDILSTDILFLCLPTLYNNKQKKYDKQPIYDTCNLLKDKNFKGIIIIKSTVEPETTDNLSERFNLPFIHNPEFLTARTANEDFHNQQHIVLGQGKYCTNEMLELVKKFYKKYYNFAHISQCTSTESELMKIYANSFYATKIQMFTELSLLCKKNNSDYNKIKDMIIQNKWVNPMHTDVPGPDGKISYGGLCFPKDTNALLEYMKIKDSAHMVLESVVKERNIMRDDHDNCTD